MNRRGILEYLTILQEMVSMAAVRETNHFHKIVDVD